MTVLLIYVDASKQVGDHEHLKVLRTMTPPKRRRFRAKGRFNWRKSDSFVTIKPRKSCKPALKAALQKARPGLKHLTAAGDFRRGCELVADLALVAETAGRRTHPPWAREGSKST